MINIEITISPNISMAYITQILENAPVELTNRIITAFKEVADSIVAMAKDTCPIKTGKLRESIISEVEYNGVTIKAIIDYAQFVVFGTRYINANPFLIEAYDSYIPELEHKIYECIYNYFKEVI